MNKRRRMMMGGKAEPLWVFEYGKTALTNGKIEEKASYLTDGTNFSGGYLMVDQDYDRTDGTETRGFVDIGGIDFSKYGTLNIECRTNAANYSTYYSYFQVGYGERAGSAESLYTASQFAPSSLRVLSFDISDISGTGYFIKGLNNTTGTSSLEIKNIWLE